MNLSEDKEIIGVIIGYKIYVGLEACLETLRHENFDGLLRRDVVDFMRQMDLGLIWDFMSKQQTLFRLDKNGIPYSLPGDLIQPCQGSTINKGLGRN